MKVRVTSPKKIKVKVSMPKAQSGLQMLWGGGAEPISSNPFSNSSTLEFKGPSHAEGGIGIQYGNNPAEVEGAETAFVGNDGNMNIMGNMLVPGTSTKFKNVMKDIADRENKATKQSKSADDLLDKFSTNFTRFGDMATTSANLMGLGAMMRLQHLDGQKNYLSNLQNAMLDTANQFGIDPQAMSKGKIKKAKNGMALSKAQNGSNINPIFSYDGGVSDISQVDPIQRYGSIRSAWKATNPGNIKYTSWSRGLGAEKGPAATDGGFFAIFPDRQSGYNAISSLLRGPAYRNMTVREAMNKYTGNAPYGQDILPGSIMDKKIADLNSDQFNTLTSGIIKGEGNAYDDHGNLIPVPKEPTKPVLNIKPVTDPFNPHIAPSLSLLPLYPTDNKSANNTHTYTTIKPKEYVPTKLPFSQVAPELLAFGNNAVQGVQGQSYTPRLYQPYQVSMRDQLNQNEADFRGMEHIALNNPEYLSSLAARKYQTNEGILGNEFRTNQGINNEVSNKNVTLLNDANVRNLGMADQQYVRQNEAISNTRGENNIILNSIASKLQQNNLMNKEMAAYSNFYPYYSVDNSTGQVTYTGPSSLAQAINFPNVQGYDYNAQPVKPKGKKASNGAIVKAYKTR